MTDKQRGFSRHLEGWQLGLVAVGIAGMCALLVVPRSAAPDVLPEPDVDGRALAKVARADAALARAAEDKQLDVEVRALGDALVAYNRGVALGDEPVLFHLRRALGAASARALAIDTHGTLELRAYQLASFVDAAVGCGGGAATREPSDRVAKPAPVDQSQRVGGPSRARTKPGPCERERDLAPLFAQREGAWRRALAADLPALRAYFKSYWGEVTGISTGAFALAPDEVRAGLRFGLLHPRTSASDGSPAANALRDQAVARLRLRKIDEIAAVDPTYPRDFARGVVKFRQGEFAAAAEAFRRHLEAHPDGPLALRAQNHLRAALERALAR